MDTITTADRKGQATARAWSCVLPRKPRRAPVLATILAVLLAGCAAPAEPPPAPAQDDAQAPAPRWVERSFLAEEGTVWHFDAATLDGARPHVAAYQLERKLMRYSPDPLGGVPFGAYGLPPANATVMKPYLALSPGGTPHLFTWYEGEEPFVEAPVLGAVSNRTLQGIFYWVLRPDGSLRGEPVWESPLSLGDDVAQDAAAGAPVVLEPIRAQALHDGNAVLLASRIHAGVDVVLIHRAEGAWTMDTVGFGGADIDVDRAGDLHLCVYTTDGLVHLRGLPGGRWHREVVVPGLLAMASTCAVAAGSDGRVHVAYDTLAGESDVERVRDQRLVLRHAVQEGSGWTFSDLPIEVVTDFPSVSIATSAAGNPSVSVFTGNRSALFTLREGGWADEGPWQLMDMALPLKALDAPDRPFLFPDVGVLSYAWE